MHVVIVSHRQHLCEDFAQRKLTLPEIGGGEFVVVEETAVGLGWCCERVYRIAERISAQVFAGCTR